ncbi:hypothetical protein Tco_0599465 [Tanacetum coccineum]
MYGFRSIHGANCTVGLDIEMTRQAFFDGHICEPPQIPTAVSNDLYQRVAEHNKLIKELQQQNVDQYKIMNSMNKNFKEGLNASSMPGPMKAPFEVREHFGLSDLSGFQNTECGPQLFTTQASGSFLEGTQTTPTYPRTPHIGTTMSQPGFASCSSRYLPSHPDTPRDVFGVDAMQRAKRDTRPSKYFLSPYRPLPETTIAPTKRVNNNRKTMRNDEISPFDLANAGIDLNQPLEEEVMVTGSCATDEYLSFYNVDPAKNMYNLDAISRVNTVGVQFWQELVPLLCKGGYYEHQKLSEVGWLSDDVRMLDGSSRPYPSWDDVDIVSLYALTLQLTVLMALQEAHDEEACLEEQILSLMHRFADRFTNRRAEINRLVSLPNHQLIEYGRYTLGCMTGADMKKATYLKSVRDELLRSMEEKRQLIKNYKEM